MLVNTFYFSYSTTCGISIFNGHLGKALRSIGINILDTNLRTAGEIIRTPVEIVHYVPGSYASREGSDAFVRLLSSLNVSQRLIVIVHGIHGYGESRFSDGNTYPQREQHIRLMLDRASSIAALSRSAACALQTWQVQVGRHSRLITLDHPGLFESIMNRDADCAYVLVGGISRTKKVHEARGLLTLLELCRRQGIRVWEHWTNVTSRAVAGRSWKQTFGLMSDTEWSRLISNAQVVLCPYQTRVQSVSGVISEALSARRPVLSTSFDLSLEMRERFPALVFVEDNLEQWPHILNHWPCNSDPKSNIPTWDSFAAAIALELHLRTGTSKNGTAQQQPLGSEMIQKADDSRICQTIDY